MTILMCRNCLEVVDVLTCGKFCTSQCRADYLENIQQSSFGKCSLEAFKSLLKRLEKARASCGTPKEEFL